MKYFMLLLFYAAVLSGAICFSFLVRCYQVIWSDVPRSRVCLFTTLTCTSDLPHTTQHNTLSHTHTIHFRQSESVTLFTKLVLVGLLMTWSSFGFGIVSLAQAMMLQVVYLTPSCEKAHLKKRVQQSLKMPRLVRPLRCPIAPPPPIAAAGTHPRVSRMLCRVRLRSDWASCETTSRSCSELIRRCGTYRRRRTATPTTTPPSPTPSSSTTKCRPRKTGYSPSCFTFAFAFFLSLFHVSLFC